MQGQAVYQVLMKIVYKQYINNHLLILSKKNIGKRT